ncbi:MAG TPA: hypothetical protein DEF02_05200 [Clostridiales bacterium]|nr:hypothetical protein [Clostridiales bacterium]HBP52497.1 hypothetical protein [Clostridiales bacterium]HBW05943.1 hypothetical protein [Clostridiales bacterium]HCH92111.1 hypothetical protein [Clostridiales bacterium]
MIKQIETLASKTCERFFVALRRVQKNKIKASPFLTGNVLPLQKFDGVNSKITRHPFPSGFPLLLKLAPVLCKTLHRSQEGAGRD